MDKTVVITGGTGFFGTYLEKTFTERPWCSTVHALGSKNYDLCSEQETMQLYQELQPDIVVHAAAVTGGIGANKLHPADFFHKNALMGLNIMRCAHKNNTKKIVLIGTSCAYPAYATAPYEEEEFWNGYPEETNATYAMAKKMLLVQSYAYRKQYGLNSVFLIPGNLYGPGDHLDLQTGHVIPAIMRKCKNAMETGEPIELWGDGSPTRDFLYAEDAAEAVALATEKYNSSDPVNVATGVPTTIRELAEAITKRMGYTGKIQWNNAEPNGPIHKHLSADTAKKEFGFEAKTSLEEGLQHTIDWFQSL